jgi:hypothetical protein
MIDERSELFKRRLMAGGFMHRIKACEYLEKAGIPAWMEGMLWLDDDLQNCSIIVDHAEDEFDAEGYFNLDFDYCSFDLTNKRSINRLKKIYNDLISIHMTKS